MEGWIKLHREIMDSQVFKNPNINKVWIYCLCSASSKPFDAVVGSQTIHLKEGQFVFGVLKASEILDIPKSSLHRYMSKLKEWGCISIRPTNKYSVVTVLNWNLYQGSVAKVGNKKSYKSVGNHRGLGDKTSKVGSKWEADGNIQEYKEDIYKAEYGEFNNVLLTDAEYKKLREKFPDTYNDWIERLSTYVESSGRKYKSHYATILNWVRKEANDKRGDNDGKEHDRFVFE